MSLQAASVTMVATGFVGKSHGLLMNVLVVVVSEVVVSEVVQVVSEVVVSEVVVSEVVVSEVVVMVVVEMSVTVEVAMCDSAGPLLVASRLWSWWWWMVTIRRCTGRSRSL